MPVIKISVPHKLDPDEAQRRIAHLISETRSKHEDSISDVKESWEDNRGTFSFRAMGFSVSGTLQVELSVAQVEIQLPFAAMLFKSRVEQEISTRAVELLA